MNYQKIYDQIIERAIKGNRQKGKDVYYEAHHIIPKFLEGSNEQKNLVLLTAREHYICHRLLTRLYPGNRKAIYTFWMMSTGGNRAQPRYRPSSRVYEEAKELYKLSDRSQSQESKDKKSKTMQGKPSNMLGKSHSKEAIEKIKQSNRGKKRSDITKSKMSESKRGKPSNNRGNPSSYTHSEETRQKMRSAIRKPYKKRESKPRGPYKKKLEN
jgi:hypothetical protein